MSPLAFYGSTISIPHPTDPGQFASPRRHLGLERSLRSCSRPPSWAVGAASGADGPINLRGGAVERQYASREVLPNHGVDRRHQLVTTLALRRDRGAGALLSVAARTKQLP